MSIPKKKKINLDGLFNKSKNKIKKAALNIGALSLALSSLTLSGKAIASKLIASELPTQFKTMDASSFIMAQPTNPLEAAYHYSHQSHYSHGSHQSHYSHYSGY